MPAEGRAASRLLIEELFIGLRAAPLDSPTLPANGLFDPFTALWLKPRDPADWLKLCVDPLNVGRIAECGGIDAVRPAFAPSTAPRPGVTFTWPIGAFASSRPVTWMGLP